MQNNQVNVGQFVSDQRAKGVPDVEIHRFLREQGAVGAPHQQEQRPSIMQTLARGVVSPVARMAASLGHLAAGPVSAVRGQRHDYDQPLRLGDYLGEFHPVGRSPDARHEILDALGVGAELASFAIGGGTVGPAVAGAARGARLLPSAVRGAVGGATGGAVGGAGFAAQQPDITPGGVAAGAAGGAVVGGTLGGLLSGVSSGARGTYDVLANRQARSQELNQLLSDPTTSVAQRFRDRTGNRPLAEVVSGDASLSEAVTQGVDPVKAFAIRHSNVDTKNLMRESLEGAERVFGAEGFTTFRSSNVVGKPFMGRVNTLQNELRRAGQEVDTAARALEGQFPEYTPAVASFSDDLVGQGVRIRPDNTLDFSESIFADTPGSVRLIERIWDRMLQTTDGLSAHRLKKTIDEMVDYGKATDGIAGTAERVVKNFRNQLDAVLDGHSSQYNAANAKYAEIISVLDEVSQVAGRDVVKGGPVAEGRAGMIMQRILSNSPNRARITELVNNLDEIAAKYGYTGTEDLISLNAFVDSLEDVFGTQATRSLQGQMRRGVGDIVAGKAAGADLSVGATGMRMIREGMQAVKGITRENYIKAIRELLDAPSR